MAKKNYYVVRIGKSPGIYTNWEDCKAQVTGYKGAVFKGFEEKKDAEDFMKAGESASYADGVDETTGMSGLDEKEGKRSKGVIDEEDKFISEITAYVDGSFLKGKVFGCGCVIIKSGEVIAEISKAYEDEELASMRNVAGEIKASELAMRYALENGYKSISIYHDYQGISSWCMGEWKANKLGTIAYKEFYDSIKGRLRVYFVKVKGHSGDTYNDMADNLAKKALGIV